MFPVPKFWLIVYAVILAELPVILPVTPEPATVVAEPALPEMFPDTPEPKI